MNLLCRLHALFLSHTQTQTHIHIHICICILLVAFCYYCGVHHFVDSFSHHKIFEQHGFVFFFSYCIMSKCTSHSLLWITLRWSSCAICTISALSYRFRIVGSMYALYTARIRLSRVYCAHDIIRRFGIFVDSWHLQNYEFSSFFSLFFHILIFAFFLFRFERKKTDFIQFIGSIWRGICILNFLIKLTNKPQQHYSKFQREEKQINTECGQRQIVAVSMQRAYNNHLVAGAAIVVVVIVVAISKLTNSSANKKSAFNYLRQSYENARL